MSSEDIDTKIEVKEETEGNSEKLKRKGSDLEDTPVKKIKEDKVLNNKWWEVEENSDDDETKWSYLEHRGVLFPLAYKSHGKKVLYKGKPINLDLRTEELATYWTQSLGTEWETRDIYRNNFSKIFFDALDLQGLGNVGISDSLDSLKLEDFEFSAIQSHLEKEKERKKNRGPDEKQTEKTEKAERDLEYGSAIVDGMTERVGGYLIEPPTLFKGRGLHPKAGILKARIMPEDITINIAKNAPIPVCKVPGRAWGDIVHNNEVTWLAFYKDDTINTSYKYIFLAANSKFKGLNDRNKYEKARKLKFHIEKIRNDYNQKIRDSNEVNRQLGTATYLIDKLALRVGNEKSDDEADTVGCCSIRVEHITIGENCKVIFDFLGKDSMRYYNEVELDEQVVKNLKSFIKGKKPENDLFDKINASILNNYLQSIMENLTAKVFRTFNASSTLQSQLLLQNVANGCIDEKANAYDEANKQVAILCNHQKTVSKSFDSSLEKKKSQLDIYKTYLTELKDHLKKIKGGKAKERREEVIIDEEKNKTYNKIFPDSKEKTQSAIEKLEKKIEKEDAALNKKEDLKSVALGTSKLNYNDPRITVAWCKKNEVPIEKVFTKTHREKFLWAMYAPMDFEF